MQKIMVIGSGGSGKSELSLRLGQIFGIDVIHLDRIHWRPGWVELPKDEWVETVVNLVSRDAWIIDGNYGGTMEIRALAADAIIFLDMPRTLCVWRVLKRRLRYRDGARPDMGEGCHEKIDLEFIKWIWGFPSHARPKIMEILGRYENTKTIFVLKSRREVDELLRRSERLRPGIARRGQ